MSVGLRAGILLLGFYPTSNLILFVLVLVLVLGDQNFIEDEDDWSAFDFAT
jgi:hypothetical protein